MPLPHLPVRLLGVLLATLTVLSLSVTPSLAAPATVDPGAAIEDFAPYQGQTLCDPVARAGVLAFRDAVLRAYPGSGDAGIVRACGVGGSSEHKEGRAWDWRVSATNPTEAAQAEDLLGWLLASDSYGNPAAMARRLGVMYIIWNQQIWKSYQATRGWQPYSGASPHTDHVHLSFGWAGAYGATSYWTGRVAPVMGPPAPPAPPAAATATVTVGVSDQEPSVIPSLAPVDPRTAARARRAVVGHRTYPFRRH